MPQQRRGTKLSKERMQKIKAAWLEYNNPDLPPEERPTQVELGQKYGFPQSTIAWWFNKFRMEESGYSPETPTTQQAVSSIVRDERPQTLREWKQKRSYPQLVALKESAKLAIGHIADRSRKSAEQAIIIGDIIMDRYSDLIKIAIAQGMKTEDLITEVFNFYERKTSIEQYLKGLETKLADLQELAEPNWRYRYKANLLFNFARQCLTARIYGVKLNPRQATRALQAELNKIDEQEVM